MTGRPLSLTNSRSVEASVSPVTRTRVQSRIPAQLAEWFPAATSTGSGAMVASPAVTARSPAAVDLVAALALAGTPPASRLVARAEAAEAAEAAR